MLAISLCGAWLVKRQGVGTLARMRAELDDGRIPTGPMTDGGLLAAAGFLLLVPGFVTDVFGLALLVPPVRARRAAWLGPAVHGADASGCGAGRGPTTSTSTKPSRAASGPPADPPELLP